MQSSEPLHHFVDDYLRYLHETQPTGATLDGVHTHDDLLEDLSRSALELQARALAGFARRLDEIPLDGLTEVERVEHPVVAANIRARIFEIEEVRTWERNPQLYADILATSLAAQAIFPYAPEDERARRVLSKLRQAPRLIQAARDNVKEPPGIFVKVGLETLRGVLKFIEHDLPRAFSGVDDLHLLGDLADASIEAADALGALLRLSRDRAGAARPGLVPAGPREVRAEAEARRRALDRRRQAARHREPRAVGDAGGVPPRRRRASIGGDPIDDLAPGQGRPPGAGTAGRRRRRTRSTSSLTFIERHDLVTIPDGEPLVVAPTPDFYRWSFASMWTPGPFETKPTRAYYYLTDVDPSWPAERQEEHLRDFTTADAVVDLDARGRIRATSCTTSTCGGSTSKLRKSILFSPASSVEGWAHYCEQMMIEAGFRKGDHEIRLGQLAEALIRLARFIVGIRLHAEDMSVEQGMRFFRDEAFMEEASARREAERGTFDPTYLVYTAGKLMLLKLRADCKAQQGSKFSLRGVPRRAARQRHAAVLGAAQADAAGDDRAADRAELE